MRSHGAARSRRAPNAAAVSRGECRSPGRVRGQKCAQFSPPARHPRTGGDGALGPQERAAVHVLLALDALAVGAARVVGARDELVEPGALQNPGIVLVQDVQVGR